MMFRREFFTEDQMQQESGGRQTDRQGRPLVGRYRDGSMPPPNRRAYGVGQMQVRTARRTAETHGVAWDENRFLTDREYNLDLADRHMQDLVAYYNGDRTLARAAYHSGQPTVDRAVSRFGRSNFTRGLGPEGRAYVARSEEAGAGETRVETRPRLDVSTVRPGEVETAQMNQGNRFQIRDPFTSGEELATEGAEVERRGTVLDQTLTGAIEQLSAIQPQREQALRTAVDTKTEINHEMQDQTRALIGRARPLMQRREAIAHRMSELADMNPLERGLRAIFDPNYNEVDLRGRDRAYSQELETLGGQFQYITNLQDTLTRLIDADYNNQNSIWTLQTENANQDVTLMMQSFGVAQSILGASMQDLENQAALIRAQATARADTLSQMTVGQVNVALEQAQQTGTGYATINGVPISIRELTAAREGFQEREDALASRQMALEGGRLDLAQRYEERLIAHMTPPQIEEAIRNGGQYQGQQLDMTRLTNAYGQLRARQGQQVDDVSTGSAPQLAINLINSVRNSYVGTYQRMQNMLGAIPEEQRVAMGTMMAELQAYAEGQNRANAQGVGAQYAQQNLPRFQALLTRQNEIIEGVARRWAGTNRDLLPVANAWLRGSPLSGEAATRGLIALARGGMPAGTQLSGPAAQAFRIVQRLVHEADNPQGGTSLEELMRRGDTNTQQQRDRQLIQRVQGALGGAYNDRLMDEVIRATPSVARQVRISRPGGYSPHPFSRVNPEDFQNAVVQGDMQGYARIGQELGLNADQTRQMFAQGENGPIWAATRQRKNLAQDQFGRLSQQLTALQTQLMMVALDASPSARPGFRPSSAYVDLINNPQFQSLISNVTRNTSSASFGDYMTSTVAGPGFLEAYRLYALGTRQAMVTVVQAQTAEQTRQLSPLFADPIRRATYTASGAEGVSPQEARSLIAALQPQLRQDSPQAMYEQIASLIQNHRLSDPALERVRQRVARGWTGAARAIDAINAQYMAGGI